MMMWHFELEPDQVIRMFLGMTLVPKDMRNHIVEGAPALRGLRGAALVWASDPRKTFSTPSIVVVSEGTKKSLLPKLMAIPGNLSPITSYTRIWSVEEFRSFLDRESLRLNECVLAGIVGMTISELALRLGPSVELSTMGTSAAQRTFSYALGRLLCAGGTNDEARSLATAWKQASTLTANLVDEDYMAMTMYLGSFLHSKRSFNGSSEELAELIQDLALNFSPRNARRDLLDVSRDLRQAAIDLKTASRERRVAMVEEWTTSLRTGKVDIQDPSIDLACGFLVSQIDPGSLDFMELALHVDHGQGLVAAAYGLCGGLLGGAPFLWKGDGFGITLVSRGLQRTADLLGSQPDISLAELKILEDRISDSGFEFRTRHPSLVEVELVPDIAGAFVNGMRRQVGKASTHESQAPQRDLLGAIVSEDSSRAKMLLQILADAVDALQRLEKRDPQHSDKKRTKGRSGKY